jgi:hypothetical protein
MNIQEYSVACATSFESNKNPSAIGREVGVTQSTTSRFLNKLDVNDRDFLPVIQRVFGTKKLKFVIDDCVISRRYAQYTEGTSSMIDQSTKTFTNGCKILVGGFTDGNCFVPISLEHWIAVFILKDQYVKTTKLAEKIILKILELGVSIEHFVLDGLYFSQAFIHFLHTHNLNFLIKAKTTTLVVYKGVAMQLKNCTALRLNSNQNQKTISAEWSGKTWYFTAIRRTGKHGNKVIYLIANFKAKSRIYRKIYDSRWTIEKFFRTAKQSLGLKNSFSQAAKIYLNHIKCVFFSYGLLQILMKKLRLDSIEDAIRRTQALKNRFGFSQTVDKISLLKFYA